MDTIDIIPPQSKLLSGNVASCLTIVHNSFPAKYDWLNLAEGAATKAASYITLGKAPLKEGLEWIRVAVELYEMMADHPKIASNDGSKRRLLMPAVGLRALAIATWGINENDPILNSNEISRRFFSITKVTPKNIKEDNSFPRNEDIRNALEAARYIDPLENSKILMTQLPELFEFYQSAKIARKNARTRIILKDQLKT